MTFRQTGLTSDVSAEREVPTNHKPPAVLANSAVAVAVHPASAGSALGPRLLIPRLQEP